MGKKVLLIDGDRYLLALTRVSLELDGFKVLTANNQEQAFRIWEDENPDMIILDTKINEDGKVTLCRQIRDCLQGNHPVIVLSATQLNEEEIRRCREEGIDWHLTKPFNTITLGKELENLLKRKQSN